MKRILVVAALAMICQSVEAATPPPVYVRGTGGGTTGVTALSFAPVRPAAITVSQNNYAPGAGNLFYITATGGVNITGAVAGVDGFVECFVNVGSNTITFMHQSASSTAANRFINGPALDVVLVTEQAVCYVYDATQTRWLEQNSTSSTGFAALTGATFSGTVAADTFTTATAADLSLSTQSGRRVALRPPNVASTAEQFMVFTIPDDANAFAVFENNTATDGRAGP